jgi:hypothetical protein
MDIGLQYDLCRFIANKQQSGYLSPQEFQNAYNLAQKQYQHELIETIIGWDANRKRVRLPAANMQQVKQKLSPFIVVGESMTVSADGHLSKPTDMVDILSMRTIDDKKRIWRVEEDRIASHLSSVIDPVSESPIYTEKDNYYKIFPIDIGNINWEYVRIAPDVIYGFTIVDGRPIYDLGSSTTGLWGDLECNDIMIRVLFMFGISIQAQNLTGYFNEVKNNGQ